MGDALEVQGLERAFSKAEGAFSGQSTLGKEDGSLIHDKSNDHILLVGSNKGTFGNSETASGLFLLIKASLGIYKGIVPLMRDLGELNDLIGQHSSQVQPIRS